MWVFFRFWFDFGVEFVWLIGLQIWLMANTRWRPFHCFWIWPCWGKCFSLVFQTEPPSFFFSISPNWQLEWVFIGTYITWFCPNNACRVPLVMGMDDKSCRRKWTGNCIRKFNCMIWLLIWKLGLKLLFCCGNTNLFLYGEHTLVWTPNLDWLRIILNKSSSIKDPIFSSGPQRSQVTDPAEQLKR